MIKSIMKLLDPIIHWNCKYKSTDIQSKSKWNEFVGYLEEFLQSFTEFESIEVDCRPVGLYDHEYIFIVFKDKKLYRRKWNHMEETEYHLTKILSSTRKKTFKYLQKFLKELTKNYETKTKENLEILKILKNF